MRALLITYRSLFQRPAFFCAVAFTLALGIGANSAIFSVIDTVLLKPLPYPNGDRLMALFQSNPAKRLTNQGLSPARVEDWNSASHSFTAISAAYTDNISETSGELPQRLVTARVSPRFFSVLGTVPLLGRTFSPEEDLATGPQAAVLSERLWRSRFGGDPNVLGHTLRFGNLSYPIIGVMPDSVRFPASDVDVWIPAQLPPYLMRARGVTWENAIGRLREGASMASAQAELASIQVRLAAQFPATDAQWTPGVEPLKEETVGGVRRSLWILFGAVTFVLLISCANVACLLLAQAHRREREIAIRFSLGARRVQVIRELLLESLALAIPGCLLGLLISLGGIQVFRRAAAILPRAHEIQLDWRLVAFTLALSVVTAVLFGLMPALRATRGDASGAMAQASRTQIGGRHSIQRILVGAQMALAIVLLIGSGLLIRSFAKLIDSSLGFDPQHVLAFRISASWGEQSNMARIRQRMYRTLDELGTIPGVTAAAITIGLPGDQDVYASQFHIAGRDTESEGNKVFADEDGVTPDYFRMLGIPVLAGDVCRVTLENTGENPVMISRSFADRYFPGENPIGHYLREGDYPQRLRVTGVVADIRKHGYARDPQPTLYWCGLPYNPNPRFVVKGTGDPLLLAAAVRQRIHAIEPARAVYDVQRLSDHVSSTLTERRFQIALLASFAATALLLAAIGLYGVINFLVSLRTREIGLRAALGATPRRIFGEILREGVIMTAVGAAFGIAGALALTHSIATFLYGIAPTDPLTFLAVPLLLAGVCAIALWLPAHRATNIDPMVALRQD